MTEQQLRIGDAEREAAAADLGEHFAQGRLSVDEHAERLEQVWAARTRGELVPVFRDLPGAYAATGASAGAPVDSAGQADDDRYWRSGLRPFRRGLPTPLVVALIVLLGITVLTHLPFILIGLGVLWFVAHRHRGHGWHHRHGHRGPYAGHPGWR